MKTISVFVILLLLLPTMCHMFVGAEEIAILKEASSPYDVRSTTNNQGVSIPDYIDACKENATESHHFDVESWEETAYWIDSCRWDESLYIISYPINLDELNLIANGSSFDTVLGDCTPTVVTPLFTTADHVERIGGYIRMYGGYQDTPYYAHSGLDLAWSTGEFESLFEKIDAFNNYECVKAYFPNTTINSMILLQFPLSHDPVGNMILLVETDTYIQILDITNAAHNPEAEEVYRFPETKVYSLGEFISYRAAYEEEAYQPNPSIIAGGDTQVTNESWEPLLVVVPVLVVLVGIITYIVAMKRMKQKKYNNPV